MTMPAQENDQSINTIYAPEQETLFPEALDSFMQGFERERFLGKTVVTSPAYWDKRIEFTQESLRKAETARKSVAVIASDAATFIEREPEEFARLPEEQQDVLNELASRIVEE